VYTSGYLLFVRDGVLFAQAFDERSLRTAGEPIRLTEGIGYFRGLTGFSAIAVSATGVLAFGPSIGVVTNLDWFGRDGAAVGRLGEPAVYSSPRLSSDGKTVVVSITAPKSLERDIWTLDVARNTLSRVTFDVEHWTDWFPIWSPNADRMFFSSTRLGISTLFERIGIGQEHVVDEANKGVVSYPDDVSRDARLLAYTEATKSGYDLAVMTVEKPRRTSTFLSTKFNEVQPRFAPNMRFIAYASDETGAFEVYVRPYPTGKAQWRVSTAGGMQPEWRRDGRELFFLGAEGKLMAVPVSIDGDFRGGVPHPLFNVDVAPPTQPYQTQYAVTADGQRFLVNTVVEQPDRPALTIMLNWIEALKKSN
jgi:hypothetical protein